MFADIFAPVLSGYPLGDGLIQTTLRGFYLQGGRTSTLDDPTTNGMYLDVEVRDAAEIPKPVDSSKTVRGHTEREVKLPADKGQPQGLLISFAYGPEADQKAVSIINKSIDQMKRAAEVEAATHL